MGADLARMTLSLGCRSEIRNAELRSPTRDERSLRRHTPRQYFREQRCHFPNMLAVHRPLVDLAASDLCTPRHSKFLRATKEKMRAAKVAMQKRSRGEDPYPATKTKLAAPSLPSLEKLAKVAMVTADQPGGAPARPHLSVQTGFDRCYTADIVVTDTLAPCWVTVSCSP